MRIVGLVLVVGSVLAGGTIGAALLAAAGILFLGLFAVKAENNEAEWEMLAEQGKKGPGLMTAFEVSDASGIPWKKVPEVLRKAGVPRADRTGWRARLPVVATKIQHLRQDIEDWLGGSAPPGWCRLSSNAAFRVHRREDALMSSSDTASRQDWVAPLLGLSAVSLGATLILLRTSTSLVDAGGGCTHLLTDSATPFVVLGLAYLPLIALSTWPSFAPVAERDGPAMTALLGLTLLSGVLAQVAIHAGWWFVLFYFPAACIVFIPLLGTTIVRGRRLSPHQWVSSVAFHASMLRF